MKSYVIYCAFAAALIAGPAVAGYPEAVATQDYCQVDIRMGADVGADNMPVLYQGRAGKGTSWRGGEGQRICARKSNWPSDCNSGLGQWNCVSGGGTGQGQPQRLNF